MSLRSFHLVFIAFSVILSAFMAAWAMSQFRVEGQWPLAATSVGAALTGVALAVYGARFQRKTRNL